MSRPGHKILSVRRDDGGVPQTGRSVMDELRQSELLEAALSYAQVGWRVYPIHRPVWHDFGVACSCKNTHCEKAGKHPHIRNYRSAATTRDGFIGGWWEQWPNANIGILTGRDSRIVVLDVDPRNGGTESLEKLTQSHGELVKTVVALTGGGGFHYYFRHPVENIKSGPLGIEYPGLDIQGDNACVIAPPSLHASGETYRWVEGREPQCTELAPLPDWLSREINNPSRHRRRHRSETGKPVEGEFTVTKGSRNNYIISFAGAISPYCRSQTELEQYVSIHNESHCKPPLTDSEIRMIAHSAARYENGVLQQLMFKIWSPYTALDKHEKAVLWTLVRYSNWRTWECWPSRETIAASASYSLKTTDRTLRSLKSKRLISWLRIPFQSNHYTVHIEKILSITSETDSSNPPSPPCLDTGSGRPIEEADSCPPDT